MEAALLCRIVLVVAGWPLSRVESGGKPPGESQRGLSPGPPPAPLELVERLQAGAALVAQGCSEFPLSAEATLRKIAARTPLQVERQPRRLVGTGGSFLWGKQTSISAANPCLPYAAERLPPHCSLLILCASPDMPIILA